MWAGGETGCTNQTDQLPRSHLVAGSHAKGGEVAVKDARVRVEVDHDVVAGAVWVQAKVGDPGSRRPHLGSRRGRKVDAGVYVPARTERVERLQLQRCAAEGLGDNSSGDHASDR